MLDEDLLLWNKFRDGDKEAYAQIIQLHYQDLYNYGSRFTGDHDLLKDCMQDLFLLLWKNRLTINETSFVKYYLFKSLRRSLKEATDKNSRNSARAFSFFNGELSFVSSPENNKIIEEEHTELANKMRALIARLSKRQQEIIYLRFYGDADVAEIASIMNLNRQSVYNLLHDALKQLRKLSHQSYPSLQVSILTLLPFLLPEIFLKKF